MFKYTYIINILRKITQYIVPLKEEHNAIFKGNVREQKLALNIKKNVAETKPSKKS